MTLFFFLPFFTKYSSNLFFIHFLLLVPRNISHFFLSPFIFPLSSILFFTSSFVYVSPHVVLFFLNNKKKQKKNTDENNIISFCYTLYKRLDNSLENMTIILLKKSKTRRLIIKGTGPSVFLLFSAKRLEKKLGHFLGQKDWKKVGSLFSANRMKKK